MKKKKSITQMPGDSKRQRADTNLTRAQENRLARQAEEERKRKLKEERSKAPTTAVGRGFKRGMQNLKKAVGLKDGGKLKMVKNKNGEMVPDYAADGVGKMAYGGKVKKMAYGGKAKVKKMGYGGEVKKMSPGGGMCRGMGKATQGGNYSKMG